MSKNKPLQSERARRMLYYRKHPAKWATDHLDIELAPYRGKKVLEDWLAEVPSGMHHWCRQKMARGDFVLDSRRSYQAEALDIMADPGFYAFKWANGIAKTATAALMVHWFMDNYPGGRVVTTAGTWSQLREQLWREISVWAGRAKKPIAASLDRMGKTHIDLGADWAAFGRAATEEATFEGVHGDYVMVLMDEAKAIKPEIFNAVRRILRGNPGGKFWWICLSSPGSPTGPFYDLCRGEQAHRWTVFEMSAYESSRIGLEMVHDDATDLGEESPLFISMVEGEFPDEAEDTIIPLSWVLSAVERDVYEGGNTGGGVDIARFGNDETCFGEFRGGRFDLVDHYTGKNLMVTAGRTRELCRGVKRVCIDDAGLGGGVTDRLRELKIKNVVPINAGNKPKDDEQFYNLGTEMLWNLRLRFRETHEIEDEAPGIGISIPNDKRLIHQLAARKYDYRSDGRLVAESKAKMLERGERSPDRAECMAFTSWAQTMNIGMQSEILRANALATHTGYATDLATAEF